MTDYKAKLSEIRQRHEARQAKIDKAANDAAEGNNLAALCHGRSPEHDDRATLLAIIAELESDAKHVRAINATLCEELDHAGKEITELTGRAEAAERALAEAREKVKYMDRWAVGGSDDLEECPGGTHLSRIEVLAALGVES